MKSLKRITVVCVAIIFLIALVPVSAFAVDPVSAATMANALAQAITAYGASQGVSMTFDVADTDGIGEGVHDLWDQFKADINDNNVPTYDSFAVTVWSTLFSKVNNHIAINLSDTSVSYLDAFWNWLLSGPAEMTKVDDQYYEWSLNQNNTVDPIVVFNDIPFNNQPINYISGSAQVRYDNGLPCFHRTNGGNSYRLFSYDNPYYAFLYSYDSNNYRLVYASSVSGTNGCAVLKTSDNIYDRAGEYDKYCNSSYSVNSHTWYYNETSVLIYNGVNYCIPDIVLYDSFSDGMSELDSIVNGGVVIDDSISVQPYVGDATPQDVYIPDNDDVNYQPLPYIGELDIPWTDSLYGDGTGTLSDAQTEAITSDLSSTIERDSTLTLAQDVPIVNPPSEVYIPLLPVTLPSFNFSFSGIWHYVVTWVGSLGAWLSLMFTVWQSLPYAIVIPVYATAVVVIVIGTLKRFL